MADAPHLCLLGDANSPHTRRWALEMRATTLRVLMSHWIWTARAFAPTPR